MSETMSETKEPANKAVLPVPPLPPRQPANITNNTFIVSKRDRVVLEIIETERSYVASLAILINNFLNPLTLGTGSNHGKINALLTPSESRSIFANADHLLRLNSSLLLSLERELARGPSLARVGKILFEFAPFFRVYMNYIDRYEEQVTIFEHLCATKQGLAALVEQCQQGGSLSLKSYLIMPVQRIPRYKMLLSELVDKTTEDHPDFGDLVKAKEKISDVAKQINESIRQQENRQGMLSLRAAIGDSQDARALWTNAWPGEDLIERYRHLVRVGRLIKQSRSKKNNKSKCVFVLLNDTLIYGDATESRKATNSYHQPVVPDKISLRAVIPLWTQGNRCHVNRRQGECTIEFLSDVKSFDIVAPTEREADDWSDAIAEAIAACSRRLLLREQRKKWNELRTGIVDGNIRAVQQATTTTLVTAKMDECDTLFELAVQQMLRNFNTRAPLATATKIDGGGGGGGGDSGGGGGGGGGGSGGGGGGSGGSGGGSGGGDGGSRKSPSTADGVKIVQLLMETTSMSIKMLDEQFIRLMTVVSEDGDTLRASAALDIASTLLLRVSAKARDKAIISACGPGRSTVVVTLLGHTSNEAKEDAFLSASGALLLTEDAASLINSVEETERLSKQTKKKKNRSKRRESLTSHRRAASAFDLTSSTESIDVVRELAPMMSETTQFSVLKSAAREGCLSLCAVLSSLVNADTREKVLRSMKEKILNLPKEGPEREQYLKVVTMLGTRGQGNGRNGGGEGGGGDGRRKDLRTRVTTTGSVVGGSITERAQQQKAASLTPMARVLLNAWEHREGLLSKRGGKIKSWKTRLFALNATLLTYHRPVKVAGALSKELGTIDLSVQTTMAVLPNDVEIKKLKLKQPCFALRTPLRCYYMHTNTDADRDAWMGAINVNIAMANVTRETEN